MAITLKDEFIDRIKAEGRAEGVAEGKAGSTAAMLLRLLAEGVAEGKAGSTAAMLLRLLAARGLKVSAPLRERVLSCTDLNQLEAWADKAMTASTLAEVFPANSDAGLRRP